MSSLKKLSAKRLNQMLMETKAEVKRRENIDKAHKDVKVVLKKYNITIDDIIISFRSKNSIAKQSVNKKAPSTKSQNKTSSVKGPNKNDRRTTVAAKYHNPATGDKWSGRGRTPLWVTKLCTDEAIDLENFKADPRFQI